MKIKIVVFTNSLKTKSGFFPRKKKKHKNIYFQNLPIDGAPQHTKQIYANQALYKISCYTCAAAKHLALSPTESARRSLAKPSSGAVANYSLHRTLSTMQVVCYALVTSLSIIVNGVCRLSSILYFIKDLFNYILLILASDDFSGMKVGHSTSAPHHQQRCTTWKNC